MRQLIATTLFFVITATTSSAEDAKFKVEGDTLFYNTDKPDLDKDYITYSDAESFRKFLGENSEILKVDLNSRGGSTEAGLEIARVVSDFQVETIVSAECSSACVAIFLAGNHRRLLAGGLLGFHRPEWAVDDLQKFYDKYKLEEGWADAFSFSNWLQEETFYVAGKIFENYAEAGVSVSFAADTLSINNDQIWYPSRQELVSAGVLELAPVASLRPRMRPAWFGADNHQLSFNIIK
jgi:hypothetical protein